MSVVMVMVVVLVMLIHVVELDACACACAISRHMYIYLHQVSSIRITRQSMACQIPKISNVTGQREEQQDNNLRMRRGASTGTVCRTGLRCGGDGRSRVRSCR